MSCVTVSGEVCCLTGQICVCSSLRNELSVPAPSCHKQATLMGMETVAAGKQKELVRMKRDSRLSNLRLVMIQPITFPL